MEEREQTPYIYKFGDKIQISNADGIASTIQKHIIPDGPGRIVLDLENVRLCDSYGLRLLLGLQRNAEETKQSLVLYRPGRMLREMLETVNLTRVFTIVDTLEQDES